MRLLRYGEKGREKPGLLDAEGRIRDLSGVISDIKGQNLDDVSLAKLKALTPENLPLVEGTPRLGPCIAGVGKVAAVAVNYRMHGVETGSKQPTEPTLFLKATSAISGPYDDIVMPRNSEKTDWEVELAVIIGKRAKCRRNGCAQRMSPVIACWMMCPNAPFSSSAAASSIQKAKAPIRFVRLVPIW